jgi:hypothetical protein
MRHWQSKFVTKTSHPLFFSAKDSDWPRLVLVGLVFPLPQCPLASSSFTYYIVVLDLTVWSITVVIILPRIGCIRRRRFSKFVGIWGFLCAHDLQTTVSLWVPKRISGVEFTIVEQLSAHAAEFARLLLQGAPSTTARAPPQSRRKRLSVSLGIEKIPGIW